MKRINALIAVLISICFTACKPITPSGMEKAFGCAVGKTTIEEFCNLFPESSIERVLRWTLGDPTAFLRGGPPDYVAKLEIVGNDSLAILRGGEPDWSGKLYRSEELSIIVTEGSYYGNDYQHIRMSFDNGVLTEIGFDAYGSADEIDNMIAFFREEFSQYYKYEAEKPTLGGGISHHQIFFDDGLTTLMLWKRDYSQCEPGEFALPNEIGLSISIVDDHDKSKMDFLRTIRIKRSKKRK
jgi:hypothetical protein